MKRLILFLILLPFIITCAYSQKSKALIIPGYKFVKRIKGPQHKGSKVLEIMIDKYGNYMAVTFPAPKKKYTWVGVYELYTWRELGIYQLQVKRAELYASTFDPDGQYFYVNTDIYKNTFVKIDLQTFKYEEVTCDQTPLNCKKNEPQLYKTDGYTVGDNYFIMRDLKVKSHIRIFVKKELYIPEMESENYAEILNLSGPPKEVSLTNENIELLKTDGVFRFTNLTLRYYKIKPAVQPFEKDTTLDKATGTVAVVRSSNSTKKSETLMLDENDLWSLNQKGYIEMKGIRINLQKPKPAQTKYMQDADSLKNK